MSFKKKITFILSSLVIPFCLLPSVYAEEWKGSCETDFPPYNFILNDKKVGMDTEIVQLVMKKMGVNLSIETFPWARVLATLESGGADLAWQFVDTPERREKFILVGPIRDGITVFAVPEDSPIKNWKELKDFDEKKVGIVRGFKYTTDFDAYNKFTKDESANNEQLIKKLVEKRFDVAIGDKGTLSYQAANIGVKEKIRFLEKDVKVVPRYIGFNKNQKEKAERFEKALNEVKNTEEYKKILSKSNFGEK